MPGLNRPRTLLVHNFYQRRGGEDAVVEAEAELLSSQGHEVRLYGRHSSEIGAHPRLGLARDVVWSRRTARELAALAASFRPQVIHVHNVFPLVSPAVFWIGRSLSVPVVQTLHNFRLLCPEGTFLRDGRICEDCLGRVPWRAVWHGCYRGSVPQSAALTASITLHRAAGTYPGRVARFIALTQFARAKFVAGGLPPERIAVKPNFVDVERPDEGPRSGALFVGRLSREKGIDVLLRAVAMLPDLELTVVGDGPERAPEVPVRTRWLGALPHAEVIERMREAACLVLPSICFEGFPRTIVEAFACGLPVIASRLGPLPEIVEDSRTGLLFEAGSAEDLARCLRQVRDSPAACRRMGENARQVYEARYTPQSNYASLLNVYNQAAEAVSASTARIEAQ